MTTIEVASESSSTVTPAMGSNSGASLISFTVIVSVRENWFTLGAVASPSSVAVTVIEAAPFTSGNVV